MPRRDGGAARPVDVQVVKLLPSASVEDQEKAIRSCMYNFEGERQAALGNMSSKAVMIKSVRAAACLKWPPPCLTTPPRLPPWATWRLRPLLRTPKRRPSILEAYHGPRSPPQAAPKSRILRFQPPGAAGSELRVAEQHVQNREGECMVFDDSFEHEAWHRGTDTRIVLVFDVWHPDLSDREVARPLLTHKP